MDTAKMRAAVQDKNHRNVWLDGSTHFEGCEYSHYPCAVLKLCDELDALRAELAAKDAEIDKRKPIPVSERMPEAQLDVQIFDGLQERWTIGFLVKLSENRYQWATNEHIYWHDANFGRVTHWMPLPEAPDVQAPEA